ncbi:MAG: PH domain-containing protein, partial [Propionibacteriaceae bacterium]|nr:PH domain-containing protein [Propionibacteriaceae bacterium]
WRKARFRVGPQAVESVSGVLLRRQRSLRLDKLEAVDIVHPLLPRLFGLVDLKLESAGGAGSNLTLAYLTEQQAEAVQAELLARTGRTAHPPVPAGAVDHGHPSPPLSGTESLRWALTGSPLAPDQRLLFRVPFGLTMGAYLRSLTPWFSIVIILSPPIVAWALSDWSILLTAVPFIFACFQAFRRHILTEANFSAILQPDGLRLRHGLTTQINQTIPIRRIQAIRLTQRWLWRRVDWWRIDIAVAGYEQGDRSSRSVLLPVGHSSTVAATLAVILPQLAEADSARSLDDALHGPRPGDGFTGSPQRARLFSPRAWRRQGFRWSPDALLIRFGWLARRVVITLPHRVQAITVHQGPLARRRRLVDVGFHSAPDLPHYAVRQIDPADAAALLARAAPLAAWRRDPRSSPSFTSAPVGSSC